MDTVTTATDMAMDTEKAKTKNETTTKILKRRCERLL
jgi:hypothetical protein